MPSHFSKKKSDLEQCCLHSLFTFTFFNFKKIDLSNFSERRQVSDFPRYYYLTPSVSHSEKLDRSIFLKFLTLIRQNARVLERKMGMSYLTYLNPQLLKNIVYVASFKHFSVQLFYMNFCNSTKSIAKRSMPFCCWHGYQYYQGYHGQHGYHAYPGYQGYPIRTIQNVFQSALLLIFLHFCEFDLHLHKDNVLQTSKVYYIFF